MEQSDARRLNAMRREVGSDFAIWMSAKRAGTGS
jgi:hypothetical protein